jgi:hypothetical protein
MEKHNASDDPDFKARAISIKEERSHMVKEHLWVLWTDYFKPPHFEAYPQLNESVQPGHQARRRWWHQGHLDPAVADELLGKIDEIAASSGRPRRPEFSPQEQRRGPLPSAAGPPSRSELSVYFTTLMSRVMRMAVKPGNAGADSTSVKEPRFALPQHRAHLDEVAPVAEAHRLDRRRPVDRAQSRLVARVGVEICGVVEGLPLSALDLGPPPCHRANEGLLPEPVPESARLRCSA